MANPEHLKILNQGVVTWNKWREKNPDIKPDLFNADLKGANLQRAYLENVNFRQTNLKGANLVSADLKGANLQRANLVGANLAKAHLKGARLNKAILNEANLENAHMEKAELENAELNNAVIRNAYLIEAKLRGAKLIDSKLNEAYLNKADLKYAFLEKATLWNAHLEGAWLNRSHLEGADFDEAHLEESKFIGASVDGKTYIWTRYFNEGTDFTGVGLDNARVEPMLKESLKGIVRIKKWEEWYKKHTVLKWPCSLFWRMSNYGLSTWPILKWFFGFAIAFALIYWICGIIEYFLCNYELNYIDNFFYKLFGLHKCECGAEDPGIIKDLFLGIDKEINCILNPIFFLRSVYFSIVTMTTLGFGDMHAKNTHWLGHFLLIIHVLLGYVLLGVLITRFAVLFSGEGPALEIPKRKR